MRWRGREQSENVEDRRGMPVGGMMLGGGGLGILVIALIAMFLGADPRDIAKMVGQAQQQQRQVQPGDGAPPPQDDAREFIGVVLKDTEEVWTEIFAAQVEGGAYQKPKLVIFADAVQTGCGTASKAVGPFYCPADQQIYIDPSFFDDLARRHGAPGDFAQAYVIAHEVAHHVQYLIGFSDIVNRVRQQGDEIASNQASVRLELQADFLAGVWANHAHRNFQILEGGDLEEAITAANQIGDDTLMRQATGRVIPERFTHGTSKQRVRWFTAGIKSGNIEDCKQLFELQYNEL